MVSKGGQCYHRRICVKTMQDPYCGDTDEICGANRLCSAHWCHWCWVCLAWLWLLQMFKGLCPQRGFMKWFSILGVIGLGSTNYRKKQGQYPVIKTGPYFLVFPRYFTVSSLNLPPFRKKLSLYLRFYSSIFFNVLGHTQLCSGVNPSSALKNYSWWCSRGLCRISEIKPRLVVCKAICCTMTPAPDLHFWGEIIVLNILHHFSGPYLGRQP